MDLSSVPLRSLRKLREDGADSVFREGSDLLLRDIILYRGLYNHILRSRIDILERDELRNRKENYSFDEYDTLLRYKGPTGFRGLDTTDQYRPERRFVSEFSNATLLGPVGPGVTDDGRVIADTIGTPPLTPRRTGISIAQSITTNGVRPTLSALSGDSHSENQFEIATLAVSPWNNYYHWTVECLLKIRLLEKYGTKTGTYPTLLVPEERTSWMSESLEIVGYEGEVASIGHGITEVNTLVVPTFPDPIPVECFWLRDRMRENNQERNENDERIYISRNDATVRQVSNRNAVQRVLDEHDIDTYVLGDLSVREQIDLFTRAELVVAPHGAGLTNILYGDDPAVVELFGDKTMATFDRLAEHMKHDYHYLQCEQDGLDIRVDPNKLNMLLSQILSS